MLARRVVPCLDMDNGRVVKGVNFQGLRDAGDPVASSVEYEMQGADEIVVLDVSATPQGRASSVETVAAIRQRLSIPLTVGGGVRSAADSARLLDAGADRIGVNTAAVARPELIGELADEFGAQCVVLAVDAKSLDGGWQVVVRSGQVETGLGVIEWCEAAERLGAGEILLTSWDRDGTGNGYDLELIGKVAAAVDIPIVASGGASSVEHMVDALAAGASAVLAASIFHDKIITIAEIKLGLAAAGVEVRP